jgi:ribonucleotide reductase alpha subunit
VIPEKVAEFKAMIDTLDITVYDDGIYIFDENPETLFDLKLLLQSCGVNVPVRWNNGRCCIDISIDHLYVLMEHDCIPAKHPFTVHGLANDMSSNTYRKVQSTEVRVVQVVRLGRRDRTFCFTEPKRNAGVFNGILTSQCSEIIEYSDENESAVCNLASLALPAFVSVTEPKVNEDTEVTEPKVTEVTEPTKPVFDFDKLHAMSKIVTYNLNRVIDVNYYPTEKTRRSNMRHRPIGIGVQGLADVFMMMDMPFASTEARELNRLIFETIYHAAVEQSCEMADVEGPYETFAGSPASRGELQFDMWNVEPTPGRYDWNTLKERVKTSGLRNSLLLAPMPTASTSQILGYNECIEPITSNIYSRRTIAGEFIMANKYLMADLLKLDLWNEKIKNNIIANNGSIQHIDIIPEDIRMKYRTVWEIPMKSLIDMAADRGAYICQSQSLNLWLEDPNYNTLTSMHFYGWKKGLKTGIYYLRRRGAHKASSAIRQRQRHFPFLPCAQRC